MKNKKLNELETKVYLAGLKTKEQSQKKDHGPISEYCYGEFVIVRTSSAGVHYGRVKEICNDKIIITESRRMHEFIALNDGDSINAIALDGISPESTINQEIESIMLTWIEIVPVTQRAKNTFDAQHYFKVK